MAAKPKVVVLVGPTASGKTSLSIQLAQTFKAEIVSADSVQVYKGLNIGSAKPTAQERQGVPHHLIDCIDVTETGFSVSRYREMAISAIEDILSRGRLPIVVGGSGLYVNSLIYPLNFAYPSDTTIRASLEQQYAPYPDMSAWNALNEIDPVTAQRLHPNDRKRIIRALEVFHCSNAPMSSFGNDFLNEKGAELPYDFLIYGIRMPREQLYERINLRVDAMINDGLIDEVRLLLDQYQSTDAIALQSIGYRQIIQHLKGTMTLDEATEDIKRETRRFAKRQIAWFKRDERIHWIEPTELENDALCSMIIDQIEDWCNERIKDL